MFTTMIADHVACTVAWQVWSVSLTVVALAYYDIERMSVDCTEYDVLVEFNSIRAKTIALIG